VDFIAEPIRWGGGWSLWRTRLASGEIAAEPVYERVRRSKPPVAAGTKDIVACCDFLSNGGVKSLPVNLGKYRA
jgi:hypothetical protein